MNPNFTTLKSITKNFVRELQHANSGKKTSLPFIVHQLAPHPIVKNNESFQVLVIGGSVCKSAILKKVNNKLKVSRKTEHPQPKLSDINILMQFIENKILNDTKVLSVNFAYPLTPISEKGVVDGILQFGTKENKLVGLINKKVGEEIKKHIFKKTKNKIYVSVANDTICLLLSGLTKYSWRHLAGGIVGTGLNFAFFTDEYHSVNLEAANFNKFTPSKETKYIDVITSSAPGTALFEKETAGAYLYLHFNEIIKDKKINHPNIKSTDELDDLSYKNIPQVSRIAKTLLQRSAQMVACQIAGIAEFKKRDPTSPRLRGASMIFNMEGSLFWKGNGYKEAVDETVKKLAPDCNIKFVEIKDSGILGAAKLVS